MHLKIPPLIFSAFLALLMWVCALFVKITEMEFPGRLILSLLVLIFGVSAVVLGILTFRRLQTTVNPMRPGDASRLVAEGVFKFSRNPMYVGFFIILLAWALYLANILNTLVLIFYVWFINRYQIVPEEKILLEKFGQEYQQYLTKTRRWI